MLYSRREQKPLASIKDIKAPNTQPWIEIFVLIPLNIAVNTSNCGDAKANEHANLACPLFNQLYSMCILCVNFVFMCDELERVYVAFTESEKTPNTHTTQVYIIFIIILTETVVIQSPLYCSQHSKYYDCDRTKCDRYRFIRKEML